MDDAKTKLRPLWSSLFFTFFLFETIFHFSKLDNLIVQFQITENSFKKKKVTLLKNFSENSWVNLVFQMYSFYDMQSFANYFKYGNPPYMMWMYVVGLDLVKWVKFVFFWNINFTLGFFHKCRQLFL